MTFFESSSRSRLLLEHDLFRKPVSTFRDHALAKPAHLRFAVAFWRPLQFLTNFADRPVGDAQMVALAAARRAQDGARQLGLECLAFLAGEDRVLLDEMPRPAEGLRRNGNCFWAQNVSCEFRHATSRVSMESCSRICPLISLSVSEKGACYMILGPRGIT